MWFLVLLLSDEDFPDNVDVEDASESKREEGQPDRSVLDLYEKLFSFVKNYCTTVDAPSTTVSCGQCSDYNCSLTICSVNHGLVVDSNVGWTTIHSKSKSKRGKQDINLYKTKEPFQMVLSDGID